tara:strand:+ start:148 stop:369 length:222 start_codon:yes stop_codon:yes gene_type:complete
MMRDEIETALVLLGKDLRNEYGEEYKERVKMPVLSFISMVQDRLEDQSLREEVQEDLMKRFGSTVSVLLVLPE